MSWVQAADEDDLQPAQAIRLELGDRRIALVRTDGGRLFAVDDTCTHEEASLSEGFVEGDRIECPRHGAQFDLATGDAKSLPAMEGLETYEVKVENGKILINV